MEKNLLPKKTLTLWKIRFSLPAVVLAAICFFLYSVSPIFLIAAAGILIVMLFIVFIYIPLYFKSYEIYFSDSAIIIKRGVLIKTTHIMPFSKMIYAETFTTPLAFLFKLSAVTLKAARSLLVIPEIEAQGAKNIIHTICGEDTE
ncbi:MAG: hypothetical protein II802_02665 [Clostridia bacterium]|nr:hypothetical protein [Clostridia bacterium]